MKQATLYKKTSGKNVKCLACSWYCNIAPNQTGICGVRLNKDGVLYSLVYGKAIGLHLDPVEKKPLYHFLPAAKTLSFGTLGCNFGCLFCQNWEMSQLNKNLIAKSSSDKEKRLLDLIDRMSVTISPAEIVEQALRENAVAVSYTYNEPAIFAEFTHDTAVLARKKGLKNIYVSNGFESPETFNYIKDYLDAINVDLKSFRGEFYQQISKAKIDPVLENIPKFFNAGIEIEVTTLLIPGHNDSEKEIKDIARFLVNISPDIPWHLSAFYPAYKMQDVPPTPPEKLIKAYDIGKEAGLKYVYVGNIADQERSSTYCPRCNELLVRRDGFSATIENIDTSEGCCKKCGEVIYGVWK